MKRARHKWTSDELRRLMEMWEAGSPTARIAAALRVTRIAVKSAVANLRKQGVTLTHRGPGGRLGATARRWTREEITHLMRRRAEWASAATIGSELDRTPNAIRVQSAYLRGRGVPVPLANTREMAQKKASDLRALWRKVETERGGSNPQRTRWRKRAGGAWQKTERLMGAAS